MAGVTTVGQWLKNSEQILDRAGISSARLDSQLLLAGVLDKDRDWLLSHQDDILAANFLEKAEILVARRLEREPVAYITGQKEFYGRRFEVTSAVLIPRPETEQLVEVALDPIAGRTRILDVGTGSGCLAITLALERPHTQVDALDISETALDCARHNANRLGADVKFFQSDLLQGVEVSYDLIVANLPYVDPTWAVSPETNFEPSQALYAGDGGLEYYQKLLPRVPDHLLPSGYLLIEIDPRQAKPMAALARQFGFNFERHGPYVCRLNQ